MQALAQKITSYFIEKDVIEKSKRELCEYIVHTKLLFLLILSIIMIISIMCESVFETVIYLAIVFKLRKHLGGYHTNSDIGCFLLSVGSTVVIVNLIIPACMELNSFIILGCILISTIVMWKIQTINHPNMDMTEEEIKANTNIAKKILLGLMIISIMACLQKFKIIITIIAISEIMVLSLLLISKILKQEVNRNGS